MGKMASMLMNVNVPANSATLEEARSQVFDSFKQACRSIPTIMEIYNLYNVVNPSLLCSPIASEFRKNSHITDPKIIDIFLFNGMEEWTNILDHYKQRHHIIGQYVVGQQVQQDLGTKDQGTSEFLKKFYKSN